MLLEAIRAFQVAGVGDPPASCVSVNSLGWVPGSGVRRRGSVLDLSFLTALAAVCADVKRIVEEGEAMASPRPPPSACWEHTDRHTGSCPRVVVTTSRGRPSVCYSAAQLERITVHIAGNNLCFVRVDFFSFLHQPTGRYQRPRLLCRVHKDI